MLNLSTIKIIMNIKELKKLLLTNKKNAAKIQQGYLNITIKKVLTVEGQKINPSWYYPEHVLITDKGAFLSDPRQNDFSNEIGKNIKIFVNRSKGFTWASALMKDLPTGLIYG